MNLVTREGLMDRLRKIEDRKIEILMELAEAEEDDTGRIWKLNEEYARLDGEQFLIKMELLSRGRPRPR